MSNPLVTDRIIQLWNLPADQRGSREFSRNTTVQPAAVWEALRKDFDASVIKGTVVAELCNEAESEWKMATSSQRQMFLSGAALELTKAVPELALDRHVVAELVYKLNCVGWLNQFGYWVGRLLDAADLFDSFGIGIATAESEESRALCFEGVGLYYRVLELLTPPERFRSSLERLEVEVRRYLHGPDPDVMRAAEGARRRIWEIRRREHLPRANPENFRAYRIEEADAAEYVVERVEDGELAIKLSRLEVTGSSLAIEFECIDPALLPEDAPAIIEDALLRRYASGIYGDGVNEAVYTNLWLKTTTTRSLPLASAPRD